MDDPHGFDMENTMFAFSTMPQEMIVDEVNGTLRPPAIQLDLTVSNTDGMDCNRHIPSAAPIFHSPDMEPRESTSIASSGVHVDGDVNSVSL